jgi:hypothetical protein
VSSRGAHWGADRRTAAKALRARPSQPLRLLGAKGWKRKRRGTPRARSRAVSGCPDREARASAAPVNAQARSD